jgi:hypothetical protein
MPRLGKLTAFFLFTVCCLPAAQAAFYIEPYLGYEIGSYQMQNPAFANGNARGFDLGARIGTKILDLLVIALDGRYGSLVDTSNTTGSVTDGSSTSRALGVTVGVDFPVLLRVWAGYNFLNQMEYSVAATSNYNGYLLSGSSTKIGIGFTPLPLFSLNVEYINYDHNKIAWTGGSYGGRNEGLANTSLGDMRRDYSTVLFSVSIPLTM